MNIDHKWFALLVVWFAVWTSTPVHGQEPSEVAETEYAAGHFATALTLFETRATAGEAMAAEVAGMMLLYGPVLYGKSFAADPERAKRYLAQAAREGRSASRYLIERIGLPASRLPDAEGEYVPGPAGC